VNCDVIVNKLFSVQRQYETKDSSLLDNNSPVTYQRRVLTNQLIKTEHDDQEDKNDKTTVRKIKEEWENDWTRYENGYKDRGNTDDKLVPLVIKKEQKNDVAAEVRVIINTVDKNAFT